MSSLCRRRERTTSFSPVWLGRKSVISTPNTRRRLQGREQSRRSREAARGAKEAEAHFRGGDSDFHLLLLFFIPDGEVSEGNIGGSLVPPSCTTFPSSCAPPRRRQKALPGRNGRRDRWTCACAPLTVDGEGSCRRSCSSADFIEKPQTKTIGCVCVYEASPLQPPTLRLIPRRKTRDGANAWTIPISSLGGGSNTSARRAPGSLA